MELLYLMRFQLHQVGWLYDNLGFFNLHIEMGVLAIKRKDDRFLISEVQYFVIYTHAYGQGNKMLR